MTVKHFYTFNFFSSHFGMFPDRKKREKENKEGGKEEKGKETKEKEGGKQAALTWEKFHSSFGGKRKVKFSSWKTIGLEVYKLLTQIFCFFFNKFTRINKVVCVCVSVCVAGVGVVVGVGVRGV